MMVLVHFPQMGFATAQAHRFRIENHISEILARDAKYQETEQTSKHKSKDNGLLVVLS
jgi:hypothetical protein